MFSIDFGRLDVPHASSVQQKIEAADAHYRGAQYCLGLSAYYQDAMCLGGQYRAFVMPYSRWPEYNEYQALLSG